MNSSAQATNAHTHQPTVLAVLSVIVLGYCWAVLQYSRNAPYFDDILEALAFTEQYAAANSMADKVYLFFISLNEHITSINHTVYLLWYHLTGSLNFRHFIWVGNLFVIVTALVLNRGLRVGLQPFAIVVFLFTLNLQIWESTFWAMTALSNQGVLLFAALCFVVLDKQRTAWWPALAFTTLAVFTQANGLLVPVAVALAFALENYRHRQPVISRPVVIWLITFVTLLVLYKSMFHKMFPSDGPDLATFLSAIQQSPLRLPIFFFFFLGSWTFTATQLLPSVIAGITLFSLLCWLGFTQLKRNSSTPVSFFLLALVLYILLSCILITVGRGAFTAIDYALNSRYKMYSIFLVLLLLHQLIPTSRMKIIASTILCTTLLVANVQRIPNIELRNAMLQETYYNWIMDGGFGRANTLLIPEQDGYFFAGYNSGIYSAYSAVSDEFKPLNVQQEAACTTTPAQANTGNSVQTVTKQAKAIGVQLDLQLGASSTVTSPSLLMCSPGKSYRITLHPASRAKLQHDKKLRLLLLKKLLPTGMQQVWLEDNDKPHHLIYLGDVAL